MDGLTGFLFGNVDNSGRLESDVFDDEEKKHLSGLSSLGVSNMITKLNEESKSNMVMEDYAIPPPSPMAIDYSNISDNELIDEELSYDSRPGNFLIPNWEK